MGRSKTIRTGGRSPIHRHDWPQIAYIATSVRANTRAILDEAGAASVDQGKQVSACAVGMVHIRQIHGKGFVLRGRYHAPARFHFENPWAFEVDFKLQANRPVA